MSIFQFVWQMIAICGFVLALAYGLFSAPWYILAIILVGALLITWKLMPSQEIWVSGASDLCDSTSSKAGLGDRATQTETQPSNLLYRGAQYPPTPTAPSDCPTQPSMLSYRGAQYASSSQKAVQAAQASEQAKTPGLKYRGAKVQHPS